MNETKDEKNKEEWNKYNENILKSWAQMAKMYRIMHSLCSNYYEKLEKMLGIPVIILGAITASSILGTNTEDIKTIKYITYLNGGLTLIITALSGINNFLGSSEKKTKHQTASFKYCIIAMNIDTILSFRRENRNCNPQEFIFEQKRAILDIRENSPEIHAGILSNYLKKYDKSLLNIETKVNDISFSETKKTTPVSSSENNSLLNTSFENIKNDIKLDMNEYEENSKFIDETSKLVERASTVFLKDKNTKYIKS